MTKPNAPASAPDERPPETTGEGSGPGETDAVAAAAAQLEQSGALGSGRAPELVPEDDSESRERALRQRDPEAYARRVREENDLVSVRVSKKGDARISRGVHHGGIGDDHFEKGDTFEVPRTRAAELEERGYVEPLDDA